MFVLVDGCRGHRRSLSRCMKTAFFYIKFGGVCAQQDKKLAAIPPGTSFLPIDGFMVNLIKFIVLLAVNPRGYLSLRNAGQEDTAFSSKLIPQMIA